jgi:FkbM family methyltransferase
MYNSQVGQDKWVCTVLKNKVNGYFIDIGATDGVTLSNTYHLEKVLGWTGICIEPNMSQCEIMKKERECICLNVAISDKNSVVRFKTYEGDRFAGHISNEGYEIESLTLEKLLKDFDCPHVIDYISLDVEGIEFEILTKFPFDDYKVSLWTIEHASRWDNGAKQRKIRGLMLSKGYKFVKDKVKGSADFEDWFYAE